ncbi:hypothetical protein TNCV_1335371 [Trichonephila clavipes]|nr:hypothetical protein TNCV_1335371 [Trichonephila clavipes]
MLIVLWEYLVMLRIRRKCTCLNSIAADCDQLKVLFIILRYCNSNWFEWKNCRLNRWIQEGHIERHTDNQRNPILNARQDKTRHVVRSALQDRRS